MKNAAAIMIMCFAFASALGLAACGGGGQAQSGSGESGATSPAPASAPGTSAAPDETSAPSAESSPAVKPAAEDPAKAEYDRACALFDEGKYYSAKAAFESSGYGDWEQRAAACVQPMPETGELWHSESIVGDNMTLEFVATQAEGTGMCIMVYSKDNEPATTLFINGSGSVETWLPGGEYYVRDATGTEWYGGDEQFGPDGHYERMVFDEVEGDRYLTVLEDGFGWTISISTGSNEGQNVGSEEESWESRA